MGLFSTPKSINYTSSAQTAASNEKKDTAKKSRLLETEGKNNGAELNSEQGRSVRRVFG